MALIYFQSVISEAYTQLLTKGEEKNTADKEQDQSKQSKQTYLPFTFCPALNMSQCPSTENFKGKVSFFFHFYLQDNV